MEERRILRSAERGAALDYQLRACAARAGADFMLLADAQGLLCVLDVTRESRKRPLS